MGIYSDMDKVTGDVFALPIDALGDYLDRLEAEIVEKPWGDILHEHAHELIQVRLHEARD